MDPATPGYAERAAALLRRDGHVVVKDVLDVRRSLPPRLLVL